ncbi:MAG: protease modulator HflC [Planctomycetota bacterium]
MTAGPKQTKLIGPLLLLNAAGLGLLAWLCAFLVPEDEYALVMRFGAPSRTIETAGLHFKWPPPVDAVVRVDRRMSLLDPSPDEYLTRDKKNVIVDSFLAWSVVDPLLYYKSVSDRTGAEARLTELLRAAVGDVMASYDFADIISHAAESEDTLQTVNHDLTEAVAARSEASFGIAVSAARVKRLNFPQQNKLAVFRRMEAERKREANAYRSEGAARYAEIKAETDRQEAEILAEADLSARKIRGEAEAAAARIYNEAIAQDPELYRFVRSIEALEGVLDERSLLILDSDHELARLFERPEAPAPADPGATEE